MRRSDCSGRAGSAPPVCIPPRRGGALRRVSAALFVALAVLGSPASGRAETECVLEGSGICYPGGFDVNTVGEVRGRAHGLTLGPRGPIRFLLDVGDETYTVLGPPRWFWPEALRLSDGVEVQVRGSKSLGRDGTLYVVAEEVSLPSAGVRVRLRDPQGRPLWMDARPGRMRGRP